MFGINRYAFWGIVVISITLLIIVILIVSTIRYNIKQKYNSINQHIFKNDSYKCRTAQCPRQLTSLFGHIIPIPLEIFCFYLHNKKAV